MRKCARSAAGSRSIPTDDTVSLSERVRLSLADDGPLAGSFEGFEVRPGQRQLAGRVADTFERGGTLTELDHCLHPHPAVTEGVQECARLLLGTSMYRPEAFPGLVDVS